MKVVREIIFTLQIVEQTLRINKYKKYLNFNGQMNDLKVQYHALTRTVTVIFFIVPTRSSQSARRVEIESISNFTSICLCKVFILSWQT